MVELARRYPDADGLQRRALDQAARELLLAQASDWAFIMKTGTTVEYAKKRTQDHIARFTYLYRALTGQEELREEPSCASSRSATTSSRRSTTACIDDVGGGAPRRRGPGRLARRRLADLPGRFPVPAGSPPSSTR